MKHSIPHPSRRLILRSAGFAAGAVFANPALKHAFAAPIYPFYAPAIRVKAPSRSFLVALTRAGSRIVAVGVHGIIIYSDDNGQSWSQANVPVNVTLTCIAFASPRIGWAAGHCGVILKTEDAGVTWKMQLNGLQVNQLTMQAAEALDVSTSTAPGAPFALRRAQVFEKGGPDQPFLTMVVLDQSHVIMFGAYRIVMMTTDGGISWADRSLSVDDRLSHNLYDAQIAGNKIYLAAESGFMFKSTDGGNEFKALTSPSSVTLLGVLVPFPQTLLVYGVAGNCYRSSDDGNSWTLIDIGTQDDITVGLQLASGAILLGSEAGELFVSRDGGVTFSAVSGQPQMAIFDFIQMKDDNFVFVGAGGVTSVAKSTLSL